MAAGRAGSQDHFDGTSARRERRIGAEDHHYYSSVGVKFGIGYRTGHFDQRTSRQYGTLLQSDGRYGQPYVGRSDFPSGQAFGRQRFNNIFKGAPRTWIPYKLIIFVAQIYKRSNT